MPAAFGPPGGSHRMEYTVPAEARRRARLAGEEEAISKLQQEVSELEREVSTYPEEESIPLEDVTSNLDKRAAARQAAADEQTARESKPQEEDGDLAKLRKMFNEFDEDGSGTISTAELQRIVSAANLPLGPAEVQKVITDADTDESGEVDFEEFQASLSQALKTGKAKGLLSVVTQTSSFFGWLNPMSWGLQAQAPADERPTSAAAQSAAARPQSAKVPGLQTSTPQHLGARRGSFTGSIRSRTSVLSQRLVERQNAQQAEEQRQAESELRRIRRDRQQQFLEQQQRRIQRFHQDEVDGRISQERFKATKREIGTEMRQEIKATYEKVMTKNQKRLQASAKVTIDARRAKAIQTAARHKELKENAHAAGVKSQIERQRRREASLATVKAQEQAAREFAAQVKYETRPDVRKETRDYFQAQRDQKCAEERYHQELDRRKRQALRTEFLGQQLHRVTDAHDSKENGNEGRRKVFEQRQQQVCRCCRPHFLLSSLLSQRCVVSCTQAEEVRQQLRVELERQRQMSEDIRREIKQRHDAVIGQRFNPDNPEDLIMSQVEVLRDGSGGSPIGRLDVRERLKSKSQRWKQSSA